MCKSVLHRESAGHKAPPLQALTNPHSLAPLFFFQPRAVRVPGLGTFLIKKWLSFENEDVLTFQRPLFVLSRTVAQIRELQHASVPVPGKKSNESLCFPLHPYIWGLCWLLFARYGGHVRGLQKVMRTTSLG